MLESIVQEDHNLIGKKENIESLAKKDHARILVLSDSHGHPSVFMNIVRRYGKECDALAFCGDGAGDLATLLNSTKTDENLKACTPPVIAFARGNGDPSSYPLNSQTSISIPDSQTLRVNGRNFLIVHGHREGVDFGLENLGLEMQVSQCKVAFYGHTHIAREDNDNGYKFVNPGSIARPRGGQPACFAIATVEKNFVDMAFIKLEAKGDDSDSYQIWNPIY